MRFRFSSLVLVLGLVAGSLSSCSGDDVESNPEPSSEAGLAAALPPGALGTAPVAGALARQAGPHLVFDALSHDFGTVRDTGSLDHAFRFRNAGTETLTITKVKASCGCTATELDRTEFAPGDGDVVRIAWTPKGFGRQTKTVDVLSNNVEGSLLRLRITADIVPFVEFEPNVADFGDVLAGTAATVRIGLACEDPELEVLDARAKNPLLDVAVQDGADLGTPEYRAVLLLTLSERTKRGGFLTNVDLELRGDPDGPAGPTERTRYKKSLSVRASVRGEVLSDKDGFFVGRVAPNGSVTYTVRVRTRSGSAFGIERAEVTGAPFEGLGVRVVDASEGGAPALDLVLEGPAGDYEGRLYGTVVVTTDVAGEEPLRFPIMGVVGTLEK